jgi:undecaprenyl-diphosphatase
MHLWFAAVMGVIQGLTEFLPISSTAHLRIAPTLLGQPEPGAAFTAVLQLGTLAAVFVYFAKDLFVDIPRAVLKAPRSPEGLLIWKIGLAGIPIVVLGLLLKKHIVGDFRSLWVVAGAMIGVGVLMAAIDARARGTRTTLDLGWLDAFLIGCAQACALVPGASRSGSTIVMALALGMQRREAARFSFLIGIAPILGAGLIEAKDVHWDLSVVVGIVVSGIVGYASIAWLLRFLSTHRLLPFAAYRVVVGAMLLVLVGTNVISATAGG